VVDLPRSAWNGTLRLRELVLPVGLVGAKRKGDVELRLLHRVCGQRVENARVCPQHGKVPDEELVRGWEIAPGEYLPVQVDELAGVAPADTRVIDVYAIVAAAQVDPLLHAKPYLLLPTGSQVSRAGYALLERAMCAEQVAALARFTAWGAEHLAAIAPHRGVLVAQELAPAEDLRDLAALAALVDQVGVPAARVERARKLLAKLAVPYEPALLTNLHRARVRQLLDARLAGGEPTIQTVQVAPAQVTVDLDQALDRSLRNVPRSRKARVDEALARA
jgi:DNA end-binding protein Ku